MKKWGDHQNTKLFINKSVRALILFKKQHQGLLKLHIPLRDCSTEGGKWGSKKGILFEAEK